MSGAHKVKPLSKYANIQARAEQRQDRTVKPGFQQHIESSGTGRQEYKHFIYIFITKTLTIKYIMA